jgi:hypothetical protein
MTNRQSIFEPGQTVVIKDYADSRFHDQRAGEMAVVRATYNGMVTVVRDGYLEAFVPARIEPVA